MKIDLTCLVLSVALVVFASQAGAGKRKLSNAGTSETEGSSKKAARPKNPGDVSTPVRRPRKAPALSSAEVSKAEARPKNSGGKTTTISDFTPVVPGLSKIDISAYLVPEGKQVVSQNKWCGGMCFVNRNIPVSEKNSAVVNKEGPDSAASQHGCSLDRKTSASDEAPLSIKEEPDSFCSLRFLIECGFKLQKDRSGNEFITLKKGPISDPVYVPVKEEAISPAELNTPDCSSQKFEFPVYQTY
jgi:hypothetical protein